MHTNKVAYMRPPPEEGCQALRRLRRPGSSVWTNNGKRSPKATLCRSSTGTTFKTPRVKGGDLPDELCPRKAGIDGSDPEEWWLRGERYWARSNQRLASQVAEATESSRWKRYAHQRTTLKGLDGAVTRPPWRRRRGKFGVPSVFVRPRRRCPVHARSGVNHTGCMVCVCVSGRTALAIGSGGPHKSSRLARHRPLLRSPIMPSEAKRNEAKCVSPGGRSCAHRGRSPIWK